FEMKVDDVLLSGLDLAALVRRFRVAEAGRQPLLRGVARAALEGDAVPAGHGAEVRAGGENVGAVVADAGAGQRAAAAVVGVRREPADEPHQPAHAGRSPGACSGGGPVMSRAERLRVK